MFDREKPIFEKNSHELHPEHQSVNTSVSEYLIKYGTGKLDKLPTDTRNEIQDNRTVEQMLEDPEPELAMEELDALVELQANADRFKAAQADVSMTQKQKLEFDNAIKVIQDDNASIDAKRDAYAILEKLERAGKITRE